MRWPDAGCTVTSCRRRRPRAGRPHFVASLVDPVDQAGAAQLVRPGAEHHAAGEPDRPLVEGVDRPVRLHRSTVADVVKASVAETEERLLLRPARCGLLCARRRLDRQLVALQILFAQDCRGAAAVADLAAVLVVVHARRGDRPPFRNTLRRGFSGSCGVLRRLQVPDGPDVAVRDQPPAIFRDAQLGGCEHVLAASHFHGVTETALARLAQQRFAGGDHRGIDPGRLPAERQTGTAGRVVHRSA